MKTARHSVIIPPAGDFVSISAPNDEKRTVSGEFRAQANNYIATVAPPRRNKGN